MKAESAKEEQFIDPLIRQAKEAEAKGKYSEAEKLYRKALATHKAFDDWSDPPSLSLSLAEVCERLGKQREAIAVYRDRVTDKPHSFNSVSADQTTYMKFVLALARDHSGQKRRTTTTR